MENEIDMGVKNSRMKMSPTEEIASNVVASMTNETSSSSTRLTTGDQYFVYAVKTDRSEYVIRMTTAEQREKFSFALYWQKKLLPLGVPLAEFIKSDLDGEYSPYPVLLMKRLPGDDLCNIYSRLTDSDKRNLANEMVTIQAATNALPDGPGYGIVDSYEQLPEHKSWYNFLMSRLQTFMTIIKQNKTFDENEIEKIIPIAIDMKEELESIPARPFLWDASERNVLVYNGKISGVVDVDDICFGDRLFVLALTHVALESEGHDTLYVDYWAEALQLDENELRRLEFYRLFYCVVFMRKHAMLTTNDKKVMFDEQRLMDMFQNSLARFFH